MELHLSFQMAQSLAKVYVHLIFSTKNREPFLAAEWRPDLWGYLAGGFSDQQCFARKIGGVGDHVHALFELHRTVALSTLVGEIKAESSKWVKREVGVSNFAWQAGYGAFSVSASQLDEVTAYIGNQEAHHAKISFQDELRLFFQKYGVDYDERYVWD